MPQDHLIAELSAAALAALHRDEVSFQHYRRIHSHDAMKRKVREGLESESLAERGIGLEFFRQAHEAWAVQQGLVVRSNENLEAYWQAWREWYLLVLSENSELRSMRENPEFHSAFERLPHEQQEWLNPTKPRQPTTDEHIVALLKALSDLDALLHHRSADEVEDDLFELVGVS